jgi:hypothetical protein
MSSRPAIKLSPKPQPQDTAVTVQRDNSKPQQRRAVKATIYLPPEVHEELRAISYHERCKMHALFMEGIDRVLADRGRKTSQELQSTVGQGTH